MQASRALSMLQRRVAGAVRARVATGSVAPMSTAAATPPVIPAVDVHTHVYLPRYMQMMRERTEVPRVVNVDNIDRVILLPGEDEEITTATGRPIGGEYTEPQRKLDFMDTHNIEMSVLSTANPWVDFLPEGEAVTMAQALNEELEQFCADSNGRFYGFGVIPTPTVDGCLEELNRIKDLPHLRGIILGTHGKGKGLDDMDLLPVWKEIERLNLVVFIHPHYGVGNEHFGDYGHALFLALGFPFETTTAIARLICSGMLDEVPDLKLLLAHSGGTLPYLAGRLDSCVAHDEHIRNKLKYAPSHYLKRLYFDSLIYHAPALECLQGLISPDQLMFGTDHPFFPPHVEDDGGDPTAMDRVPWTSTVTNIAAANEISPEFARASLRENALRLLNLHERV